MASQATFYGVPLRLISLVILVVQNSALTILLHYVRLAAFTALLQTQSANLSL